MKKLFCSYFYLNCILVYDYFVFMFIQWLSNSELIENNVCSRVTNCFSAILVLFPELRSNEGNKHQNNTWVSAETVRHESTCTYIIWFLTRRNESINDDKNDDLYTSSPCLTCSVFVLLMTSQSITDDVTMTRQLWHDHVDSDF